MQQQPGRSFRHRFEGPFFRQLFVAGVRHMPAALQRLSMPLWAGIFYVAVPRARRGMAENLDRVLGQAGPLRRAARTFRAFLHYSQTLTDTYAMHFDPGRLPVEPLDHHHIYDALARGRGLIVATGHLGMWQCGPFLAARNGRLPPFHMAMAEEPNPLVQQFEQRFREGFRVIYTTGSPFSALAIRKVLREGAMVGIQSDRSPGGPRVAVPFCGRTAWFSLGPATLARLTGAPLVPLFFLYEPSPVGRGRRVVPACEPPIEIPETEDWLADARVATERLAAVYERYVRRYPLQWYHFHPFFEPPEGAEAQP